MGFLKGEDFLAVKVTDTTLRDGHQSLWATRLKTEDMLPIAAKMDQVGFYSLEVWGGATFDTCMRFLNEDPWERLDALRQALPCTRLQMLLRGQNLVGYKHYPDDVVEAFVRAARRHGIDIFRIFDALNDLRNLAQAMKIAKQAGGHVQGTICYTISPVHNIQYYVGLARGLEQMGADSICIKDMAGLLGPWQAEELVREIKAAVNLPVHLHCHYTSGMAAMAYLKGIEAGADGIDTAISPLAMRTSQPATETMAAALAGSAYDPGLDMELLAEIADYFKGIKDKYHRFDVVTDVVDVNVLRYQIPGGMISNFISQLRQQNALDKLPQVLEEVPRVREDLGYPPLVTPTSQIVGSQAVLNVLSGQRYGVVNSETRAYLKGLYGQPPGPVNPEVRRQVIGEEEPITCRPADLLPLGQLEEGKRSVAAYMEKEEDILSYLLFPNVAETFLQERMAGKVRADFNLLEQGPRNGEIAYYPV